MIGGGTTICPRDLLRQDGTTKIARDLLKQTIGRYMLLMHHQTENGMMRKSTMIFITEMECSESRSRMPMTEPNWMGNLNITPHWEKGLRLKRWMEENQDIIKTLTTRILIRRAYKAHPRSNSITRKAPCLQSARRPKLHWSACGHPLINCTKEGKTELISSKEKNRHQYSRDRKFIHNTTKEAMRRVFWCNNKTGRVCNLHKATRKAYGYPLGMIQGWWSIATECNLYNTISIW